MDDDKYAISVSKSAAARDRFTMVYLRERRFRAWALWKTGNLTKAQEEDCLVVNAAHALGDTSSDRTAVQASAALALGVGVVGPDMSDMPIKRCYK